MATANETAQPLYNLGLPGGNNTEAVWYYDVCPNTEATMPYSIVIIVAMCIYLVAFGIGKFSISRLQLAYRSLTIISHPNRNVPLALDNQR